MRIKLTAETIWTVHPRDEEMARQLLATQDGDAIHYNLEAASADPPERLLSTTYSAVLMED